jgi:hypothetical protein
MNAYASSADDFNRLMEDILSSIKAEVRHAVDYVDRVVVPEVRRESGSAMRTVAIYLERWADKLDPDGKRAL